MGKRIFVTGIDTEVGKTVASAILTEALECDYWKPVQSGDLDNSDTLKVKSWVSNSKTIFHKESYRLTIPASPHYSAKMDGVEIDLDNINAPETDNDLLIEGAGGLMVPLNERGDFILDVIQKLDPIVVLVSKNYLGSINHTLSSFEVLKSRGLKVDVLIFNGEKTEASEQAIEDWVKPGLVLRFPELNEVSKAGISDFVSKNKELIANGFGEFR